MSNVIAALACPRIFPFVVKLFEAYFCTIWVLIYVHLLNCAEIASRWRFESILRASLLVPLECPTFVPYE